MKSLRYLNKYLFRYKWRLILGVIFIIISNYFGVEMPKIVKNAVNDFLLTVKAENEFYPILLLSLKIAGIYIIFSILKGFFLFLTRQMIIIVSRYIEFDLKNEIYLQYQRLGYLFYKKNKTGDLMNRISEDVTQVRMYLGPGLMYTINLVVLSIMAIYAMMRIHVSMTLIVLAPLPIMSYLIYKVSSKMNNLSKKKQEELSHLTNIVQESFSGIRVIKAYLREKENNQKFFNSADEYKKKSMNLVMVNALFMPTIVFLIGLSVLLTVYYGGVLSYDNKITPGDIVAFIFYVNMMTWPFASVGWVTSINQRAAASQSRINEFLNSEPEIKNPTTNPFKDLNELVFDKVSFTYENSGINAIDQLSFKVKKGQTLGIVGRTGSGKSTILNLICRLLDPVEGTIFVDNQNLKEINLDEYRNITGAVPQDVFLFSDTIANNLKFGVDETTVTDDDLVKVCQSAQVYHNILDFPEQMKTLLGERGVNLSGGQKQRISIARALLRKPKLLLLDDCLSAVDTETEEAILKSLNEIRKDSIHVIVSHRISSLRNADNIIVIDKGKKIEEGSHESLINEGGVYYKMYQSQLVEND
ncbi:MAG: ABC transporter ATP-binding protein [Flavobacteriia bacterium]|nr:ABC transporter ATP-binding protein [Flavobacteriia bacterium]